MSNYTVELRQIDNVFDFDYPFYEEQFKCEFEEKFIKHYYFDEIGFETIFRFKQRLEAKLLKKMPYWTQLYQTELESQGISWLLNKDLKETWIRTLDTTDNVVGNIKSTNSNNTNSINKTSNIADGVANVGLTNGSLTGMSDGQDMTLGQSEGKSTEDRKGSTTEKYELLSQGNIGTTSSAELLDKWREILINLDEIIIDECQDLFLGIF